MTANARFGWVDGDVEVETPAPPARHKPILKAGDLPGHEFHGNQYSGPISTSLLKPTHDRRYEDDPKRYDALLTDVKANGIKVPLEVEHKQSMQDWLDNKPPSYYVVSGHHRLWAAKQLGMKTVPANVTMRKAGDFPGHPFHGNQWVPSAVYIHGDAGDLSGDYCMPHGTQALVAARKRGHSPTMDYHQGKGHAADIERFGEVGADITASVFPCKECLKQGVDSIIKRLAVFYKGDVEGHQFHGNQWTGGMGGGPITADEARGNSRPVSPEEFSSLSDQGHAFLQQFITKASPPDGLDRNWGHLIDTAYAAAQESWGGVTIDAHTGQPVDKKADAYAITVKQPGQESVTIPENADKAMFERAMKEARQRFGSQLANAQHNLGVFHDDDTHRIDIDPVLIVKTPQEVEAIGAATHAVGGAYHFASGNGYFPPHVGEDKKVRVLKMAGEYKSHAHFHAKDRDPNRPFFETNPSKAEGVEDKMPGKHVPILKVGDIEGHNFHGNQWTGGIGGGGEGPPPRSQAITDTPPPRSAPIDNNAALTGQDSLSTFPSEFKPLVAKRLVALNLAQSSDPDTALREAKDMVIRNMEDAYSRGQEADEHWYQEAHDWAADIGQQNGLTTQQVAAITSSLSPLRNWEDNKAAVGVLLKTLNDNKPFTITKELADDFNARRKSSGRTELKVAEPGTFKPQDTDPTILAALHPDMPVGAAGVRPVIQAIAIARGADIDKMMSGPKTRSFVNNITDPNDERWTTIDTWMYRAMLGDTKMPLTLDGKKGNYTLAEFMKPRVDPDTGKTKTANTSFLASPAAKKLGVKPGIGLYPVFVDAVKEGARLHGITPNAYQARVWSTLVRESK